MGFLSKIMEKIVPEPWTPCSTCSAWEFSKSGHKVCRKSEEYWELLLKKQLVQKELEEESKRLKK